MIADRFIKTSIYVIAACLLIIFCLIQPYNLICRINKKCQPIILSSLIPHKKGQEQLIFNFDAKIPQQLKDIIEFYPHKRAIKVINGQNIINFYQVKNLTNQKITIQATYHITPIEADKYLDKIECLCFQKQTLKPQEAIKMKVNFRINSKIEDDTNLYNLKEIKVNYEIRESLNLIN